MNEVTFESLGLIDPILKAVGEQGYEKPTPIQAASIPSLLEGRDLLGCAQTGTGKTASFALPIIQHIAAKPAKVAPRNVRALVVAPTRELAAQIDECFDAYSRHARVSHACIFGGVGKAPQERALSRGVDVLVATPGRLLDLQGEGKISLSALEIFVLDEADRMLDMGFIHDVKRIIALLPKERQTLLFSATMPPSIAELAAKLLRKPVRVDISPESPTVELIDQSVVYAEKNDKRHMLAALIEGANVQRALVFTRTKHGADRLVKSLERAGISSAAIHANKSQNNRIRTLESFRSGSTRVLVATDLAARGIDVDGISHVFNYELPNEPETYVHRIGRTARAGADGIAIALCESEEKPLLRDIERLIGKKIPTASGPLVDAAFKAAALARAEEAKNPQPVYERPERPERGFRGNRGQRDRQDGQKAGGERKPRGEQGDRARRDAPAPRGERQSQRPAAAARPSVQPKASAKPAAKPQGKSLSEKTSRSTPGQGQRTEKPRVQYASAFGTGRAPSRGSAGDAGSRSHSDAIRNAIRDLARGEDDLSLAYKNSGESGSAGRSGRK
jgi:ATP-dependent RNA helicase RhlE